jgi:hypothetical protein
MTDDGIIYGPMIDWVTEVQWRVTGEPGLVPDSLGGDGRVRFPSYDHTFTPERICGEDPEAAARKVIAAALRGQPWEDGPHLITRTVVYGPWESAPPAEPPPTGTRYLTRVES